VQQYIFIKKQKKPYLIGIFKGKFMQKNKMVVFFLIGLLIFSVKIIEAEQAEHVEIDNKGNIPPHLMDKRENEKRLIDAFITQVCADGDALRTTRDAMIAEAEQSCNDGKVGLCYMPRLIGFMTWVIRWVTWDNSPPSLLEIETKKLDDWRNEKRKEIDGIVDQYTRFIPEAHAITKEAGKKVEKAFLNKRGELKQIGKETSNGFQLLHEPNKKYLTKPSDIIQEKIIPKCTTQFHNQDIPVTQEEVARILAANLVYLQNKEKLEKVLRDINTVVEQYEQQQKQG